ncbi:hypothetical protein BJY16_008133 [Actinoplanes octamycinicus]|uniref:Uncharacterized protein n=1 Tax=Actinoplanes octamycinicus TaxID=135948 RepID=A0A7W7H6D7_9ACTN|nr:hypothetical protein [Actinoplanes octamycinicus]MBB4744674.1 hypothetical protein [Actinoplanes octamycinicus]GIE55255.1 hypothetical protein Aoc01nite_06570 [Actinoplanes octamycinicus]
MVSDVVQALPAVSGWVALRRSAIGAGLALAACLLIALLGRPMGAFPAPTVLVWASVALYSGFDRHCRVAAVAAWAAAALVWFGVAPLLPGGITGDVVRAAAGVLAASQMYALVTHAGREPQFIPAGASWRQDR